MNNSARARQAAETARKNFTKYPRWLDSSTGEERAFTDHPLFHTVRWLQRNVEVIDEWRDGSGRVAMIEYLAARFPRESRWYKLRQTDPNLPAAPGNLSWYYSPPSGRDRNTPEGKEALRTLGNRSFIVAVDAGMPEGTAARPGVPLPEGNLCLCEPFNYWPDCTCRIALEARYGS